MASNCYLRLLATLMLWSCAVEAEPFDETQVFLKSYCQGCHQGKSAAGGFDVNRMAAANTLRTEAHKWMNVVTRVRNGEMPPKGSPAPALDDREAFVDSIDQMVRAEVCASGVVPGPAPVRRLNRDEYAATVRDVLNANIDVGRTLPADGAGGEGFDNAAETLFLSPIHAEKYLEAARFALEFTRTDAKARARVFIATPGPDLSEDKAAHRILSEFLPRAFRRPIQERELEPYLALYRGARKEGETFEAAVLFALRGVLVSPQFLFRTEPVNPGSEPRLLDGFSLASRLSYFLWGTLPDELLFDIAATGRLQDPEILKGQIARMLRNPKSTDFAKRFVEQWLRTRDLGVDKVPDANLFPDYAGSEDLRSDIWYQPVMFFRELLTRDESLLNLLDSRFTVANRTLIKFYGMDAKWRRETATALHRIELPEGSDRGGLLGMPAVMAVSSYPNRTSPVLRGAWVLDAILGTPPPPPPPDVPPLPEQEASRPSSVRDRLTQHRENPVCASCHDRIDPLGFALENYDVIGRWRVEDGGTPIDSSGQLADGTTFNGPKELKSVLLDRKDLFVRNLANKMLGYALGRGLTLQDSCTVDSIVEQVKANDYRAQSLVEAIVFSMPFRYQAGAAAPAGTKSVHNQESERSPAR